MAQAARKARRTGAARAIGQPLHDLDEFSPGIFLILPERNIVTIHAPVKGKMRGGPNVAMHPGAALPLIPAPGNAQPFFVISC